MFQKAIYNHSTRACTMNTGYNILLVDDNPQNLATLSRILTKQGYRVRTAISGQVALKSVNSMLPDLILLDIRMPEMDGYEVCRRLKNSPKTQDIPVLFLSALDAPEDKIAAFDVGGLDYIIKPFHLDEVIARVKTHLALRTMREQLQTQNAELSRYRDHLEALVEQRTKALQASEQQYRFLADHVQDGIVIIRQGQIVFANTIFVSMLQCPLDQLLGQELLHLFPAPYRSGLRDWLASSRSSKQQDAYRIEVLTAQDQKMWTELEQSEILWDSQTAILLTIRDIHECKLRESRLEKERQRLQKENLKFKSTLQERYKFGELVGKSPGMQRVYEYIVSAAASDVNTLIIGESGTGKELIARSLHQASSRRDRAFVPINCASIPETLFEREFFGHRKGAFTGADRDTPGFFDQAHRGVLFLDEVTELSPGMQAKLLRVLQDGEYIPLGDTHAKQADVLLVAATNKAWKPLIQEGTLREDFFYRICVIEIQVPPLRDRKEDLSLLTEHFLSLFARKQKQSGLNALPVPSTVPGDIQEALYRYNWPGNVRELQNVLQRYLATQHLTEELDLLLPRRQEHLSGVSLSQLPRGLSLPDAVKECEKQLIMQALEQNRQHKINTAKMLGIPRSTLHRKIKEYRIRP
ncbi:sigma-54-dependent Fis family transcriptional regulator [candidate division KSB3 bacterium]|uniref:Sigma-54-dependent Fis family transcriptional regulator n=1 Tax=candidate division KSB3 bacterium TaxID=2044937 RepID=A0A2G6K6E5_9BACT|nr:MAG: sigma-54-dependent Fis family transcriptional regulator [candidate division KSB3 bacterium]